MHRENILLRPDDSTFITFACTVQIIDPHNLGELWKICKSNPDKNIILDSRLVELIIYMCMKYSDYALIYDVNTCEINTIYEFGTTILNSQITELNLSQLIKMLILKLCVSYYLQDLGLNWNVSKAMEIVKLDTSTIFSLSILLNYVGIHVTSDTTISSITQMIGIIKKTFDVSKLHDKTNNTIRKIDFTTNTIDDLYVALLTLKDDNYYINFISILQE